MCLSVGGQQVHEEGLGSEGNSIVGSKVWTKMREDGISRRSIVVVLSCLPCQPGYSLYIMSLVVIKHYFDFLFLLSLFFLSFSVMDTSQRCVH